MSRQVHLASINVSIVEIFNNCFAHLLFRTVQSLLSRLTGAG